MSENEKKQIERVIVDNLLTGRVTAYASVIDMLTNDPT
jgi:hypothetical protein